MHVAPLVHGGRGELLQVKALVGQGYCRTGRTIVSSPPIDTLPDRYSAYLSFSLPVAPRLLLASAQQYHRPFCTKHVISRVKHRKFIENIVHYVGMQQRALVHAFNDTHAVAYTSPRGPPAPAAAVTVHGPVCVCSTLLAPTVTYPSPEGPTTPWASWGIGWCSFCNLDCRNAVFSSCSRPCRSLALLLLISSSTLLSSSCSSPLEETDLSCTATALE